MKTPRSLPIVLLRAPYGRGGFAALIARLFAERGYQAVLQEVRGTGVSGGEFDAFRNERADGLATLDWLARSRGSRANGRHDRAQLPRRRRSTRSLPTRPTSSRRSRSRSARPSSATRSTTAARSRCTRRSAGRQGWAPAPSRCIGRVRGWLRNSERPEARASGSCRCARRTRSRRASTSASSRTGSSTTSRATRSGTPVDHSRRLADVRAPVSLLGGWYDILILRQLADYVGAP